MQQHCSVTSDYFAPMDRGWNNSFPVLLKPVSWTPITPRTYHEYEMHTIKRKVPSQVTMFSSLCRPWLKSGAHMVMFFPCSSWTCKHTANTHIRNRALQLSSGNIQIGLEWLLPILKPSHWGLLAYHLILYNWTSSEHCPPTWGSTPCAPLCSS